MNKTQIASANAILVLKEQLDRAKERTQDIENLIKLMERHAKDGDFISEMILTVGILEYVDRTQKHFSSYQMEGAILGKLAEEISKKSGEA